MSRLEDLLHDAADGPVRFDHRDIARRVRRDRRNRFAAAAALVVLAVVGLVAGLDDDDVQEVDSVGPVVDGVVTVDELVADRWVAVAHSAVVVPPDPPPFLHFGADGRIGGIDGCAPIVGDWELDGARLRTSLEEAQGVPCADETAGVAALLESDPTVGRFEGDADTLQLAAGDDFVAFRRFDHLGEQPNAALLDATWTAGAPEERGGAVTFEPDGTGRVEVLECSQSFDWSLEGDALAVGGLDRNGIPCNGGVVGGGVLLTLVSSPRLRVDGSTLWVSSDLGIHRLRSSDAASDPPATTTTTPGDEAAAGALERAADSVRFVIASADGVTVHDGGQPQRISERAAAVAFAVGSDVVVHQPAATEPAQYPPTPEGTPRAWISGEERTLPVDPEARRSRLLDATELDGAPVALVAEARGGVGPDDTFEELVLIDVRDGRRSTVVRRPAWESAHLAGAVLPDGDVIGLYGAESLTLLARWSPDADGAVWTVEVGVDSRPTLAVLDGQVSVVEAGFDEDLSPVLRIQRYGTDGARRGDASVTVADPQHQLGAGLFCPDWYDAEHLLCGRGDGPPVVVSTSARSFRQPATATTGYPTIVRAR